MIIKKKKKKKIKIKSIQSNNAEIESRLMMRKGILMIKAIFHQVKNNGKIASMKTNNKK